MPTYNSAGTLQKALDSIYSQTFTGYEIIIIDGLSNDGTMEIIKENANFHPVIRFVSDKDQGVYDAFNKGLSMISGQWIYFLGSDDCIHEPTVLEKVNERCREQPCDLLYGNVLFVNAKQPYDGPFTPEKLLKRNISHQAIFYNKRVFTKLGPFNTRFKIMADWDFNLKCFFRPGFTEVFLDLVVADFAVEGLSSHMDVLFLREVLVPELLQYMNLHGMDDYLGNISRYDDCWRLLRNANIRSVSELESFSRNLPIPDRVRNMLRHQIKISSGLLKNGIVSKTCMFTSYIFNLVKSII